ncbi:YeeE/YedE family protein [Tepidibacillus marianensis]|uniref:YeeE/YedE family protein n=1 Tax=Tepidibacillus marianensis TaxID=3131995 RepID=UPI0030D15985
MQTNVAVSHPAPIRVAYNRSIIIAAILLPILGVVYLYQTVSLRQATLYLIGLIAGIALYHAHFGFTSAWRHFILDRRGEEIRVQMLLMMLGSLIFLPLLIQGTFFGQSVSGYVSPVGTSLLVGAFIFGIGMQLGDGCASGTLYHLGGGDLRALNTLIFFIVGSVLGAKDFQWWMDTPNIGPVSFINDFGIWQGLVLQIILAAIVVGISMYLERKRHGQLLKGYQKPNKGWKVIYQGPWSLVVGAIILALVQFSIFVLSGKPWGITSAFALWGSKVARSLGVSVESWGYWQTPARVNELNGSIFSDVTSVLDIGIILGALLAAGLAIRFTKPIQWKFPLRSIIGSSIGGLLMGYGARIAFGCNIGAYFSGIVSFSLHGWLWFAAAFIGSIIGVKLRPLFAYSNHIK